MHVDFESRTNTKTFMVGDPSLLPATFDDRARLEQLHEDGNALMIKVDKNGYQGFRLFVDAVPPAGFAGARMNKEYAKLHVPGGEVAVSGALLEAGFPSLSVKPGDYDVQVFHVTHEVARQYMPDKVGRCAIVIDWLYSALFAITGFSTLFGIPGVIIYGLQTGNWTQVLRVEKYLVPSCVVAWALLALTGKMSPLEEIAQREVEFANNPPPDIWLYLKRALGTEITDEQQLSEDQS